MKTEYSGTARSGRIGFAAIVIMWITAAVSVPFSKILFEQFRFSAEEILIVRSLACILAAVAIGRAAAWRTRGIVVIAGLLIGASSIGFYRAIASWSVNPVIVILTLVPVVTMIVTRCRGKHISATAIASLAFLIAGTAWALEPWNKPVQIEGFLWALSCVVLGGIGFDLWGRAPKETTVSEKCFWLSFWTCVLAFVVMKMRGGHFHAGRMLEPQALRTLAVFVGTVTIYIFFSIVPVSRVGKMNTVTAVVLMQFGTPVVIVGAELFVGEKLLFHQWPGVITAIAGAIFLSIQTLRVNTNSEPSTK